MCDAEKQIEPDRVLDECIGEYWPPADPSEPVEPRRVPWILAPLAGVVAPLFPRRIGPHLAASGWVAAYVVQLLSVALFFGLCFAALFEVRFDPINGDSPAVSDAYTLGEHVRRPFAALVLVLFELLGSWIQVGTFVIVITVVEAGVWLVATALIALFTAGEGRARLYFRCVKLLLWSSVCLVPLGVVLVPLGERLGRYGPEGWMYVFMLAWLVWWLSVLIRLGGRYAGPREGPRWEPRTPSCESCGYALTGLSLAGRCPECGRTVRNSLPERRRLPAFATARSPRDWIPAFFRTTRAVLSTRRFARAVSVWRGQRAARNYALTVCVLIGLIYVPATLPFWPRYDPEFAQFGRLGMSLIAGVTAGLSALTWLLVVGLFVTGFGFRDSAPRAIVLCYWQAWSFVPMLLGIAGAWAILWARRNIPTGYVHLPFSLGDIDKELVIGAVLMAPALITLILGLFRLRRMLQETRYANS